MMTPYFEVIKEIELNPLDRLSPVALSWRGDSSAFALLMKTTTESFSKVCMYSKNADMLAVGRNVTDGLSSSIQGIGSVIAYAPNGSLVAFPLRKSSQRFQVEFFVVFRLNLCLHVFMYYNICFY
jgi:hypothetical protein